LIRLWTAIVCILLLCVVCRLYADDGCFSVRYVEVKQKANDAVSAKAKALAGAFRFAFQELLQDQLQMNARDAESISRAISPERISDCVYDYSVEHEKYSDSYYIAQLSCRFSKKNVAILLESQGVQTKKIVEENSTADAGSRREVGEPVSLIVYLDDFICHFQKLNKLGCKVAMFSPQMVAFVLNSDSLDEFRELGIKYAYACIH
jgi:hypothetical protein